MNKRNNIAQKKQVTYFYINYGLFLLMAYFTTNVLAQNHTDTLDLSQLIIRDSNYIHFYHEGDNYSHLFNKWSDLLAGKDERINILQIGGSHIQADVWSNQTRKKFQDLSPQSQETRGFLFPFKLGHTNNPANYRVSHTGEWEGFRSSVSQHESSWGLSGITATTKDSLASFKITFPIQNTITYCFNRIKVFHDVENTSFDMRFVGPSPHSIQQNKTIGYTEFSFQNTIDSLEFEIIKKDTSDSAFHLYGLSLESGEPGIVYHAVGVNGASTESFLRCHLFKKHLHTIDPDLVIFCLGINDAYELDFDPEEYEKNYDTLISWIKHVSPQSNFLFVTNNDSYYKRKEPNERAEIVRQRMIALTKKHHAGMWDLYHVMGGLGSISKWEENALAKKDKIHFTNRGYEIIGDLLFWAIMNNYEQLKK